MCDQYPLVQENIVTGDDLVLPVQSGIKTAIDDVVFTDFAATKKESSAKIQDQKLLIAFFDNKGIIHKEFVPEGQTINPYSAKGLGDRLYAALHKMPGEVDYSFCLFLKSKNSPLYTSGSHFIHSTARSKPSLLNHFPIYYRLL